MAGPRNGATLGRAAYLIGQLADRYYIRLTVT
jgi:hypothetical protein